MSMEIEMRKSRHVYWALSAVGATVALVAFLKSLDGEALSAQDRQHKWIGSAICIVFSFAWLGVTGSNAYFSKFFSGTSVEGIMALLVFGFWAAVMPAIMNPKSAVDASNPMLAIFATNPLGGISNANLYFSSWLSFITSFFVLMHFLKQKISARMSITVSSWGALTMTSLIAMVAASRIFQSIDCTDTRNSDYFQGLPEFDANKFCKRLSLAVSVGAVSGLVSSIWLVAGMFLSTKMGVIADIVLGFLMLAIWTFDVGYVTFGDYAPATEPSNLYFFTWGSFAITLVILVKGVYTFFEPESEGERMATTNAEDGTGMKKVDENMADTGGECDGNECEA